MRHFFCLLICLVFTSASFAQAPSPNALPVVPPTPTPSAPTLSAKSFVLMDFLTGRILASKDADLRVEPASITKVMTSYVVSKELANGKVKMDEPVFVSEFAWRGGGAGTDGSTSFLKVNEAAPLKDLLYGMIIQSGNDASIALAEHIAGSEETFVQMMNAEAKRLGMNDTHFMNSHGLSAPEHYTTAADVAKLSRALITDFPEEYRVYALKEYIINGIKQHNRNTLLWRDASVDGIKTGHHSAAGYCLAASALRDGTRLITAVMGAKSEKVRADETQALMNYGFRFFETHTLYPAEKAVTEADLWKGVAVKAQLGAVGETRITIPRGSYARLKAEVNVPKPLLAPLTKGQVVGSLTVTLDGIEMLKAPLMSLEDYPEAGFLRRVGDSILLWFED